MFWGGTGLGISLINDHEIFDTVFCHGNDQ